MKLTTRTNYTRTHPRTGSIDYEHQKQQYMTPRKDSVPLVQQSRSHYSKRQTCPDVIYKTQHNPSPVLEASSSLWKTTPQNQIYSKKYQEMNSMKQSWKILTLEEIKRQRQPKIAEVPVATSRKRSQQKLYVSISKSNKSSSSRSSLSRQPRLVEVGRPHTFLSHLNSRARIVDQIEMQLEGIGKNNFLC